MMDSAPCVRTVVAAAANLSDDLTFRCFSRFLAYPLVCRRHCRGRSIHCLSKLHMKYLFFADVVLEQRDFVPIYSGGTHVSAAQVEGNIPRIGSEAESVLPPPTGEGGILFACRTRTSLCQVYQLVKSYEVSFVPTNLCCCCFHPLRGT